MPRTKFDSSKSCIFGLFFVLFSSVGVFSNEFEIFPARSIGLNPGPKVKATQGEVWPKPQEQITLETYMIVQPSDFTFKIVNKNCDILEDAVQRYMKVIKMQEKKRRMAKNTDANIRRRELTTDTNFAGYLDALKINLLSECENLPYINMDEKYELRINTPDEANSALLVASSLWGILRGLETFSQLLHVQDSAALIVRSTSIMDFPRFSHRGLLVDTSRHYLPLKVIYKILDAMAMNKFNVFHWHIVDDQSFPYQSRVFPRLGEHGAYTFNHIYKIEDVKNVVKYATLRGIRVIPEFDTPGHTRSWGEGYPQILTQCYEGQVPDGSLGPMNPIINTTYTFMEELLKEIREIFPDKFIHLGGDEVDLECWQSNPEIIQYVQQNKLNFAKLEEIYINKLIDLSTQYSWRPIVWQEVFDNGANIDKDTIVHVWKVQGYKSELSAVTSEGYTALLSAPWYLDHEGDWIKFYNMEPNNFNGTDSQKRKLLGGEACMWGEHVDSTNIMTRIWPRACSVAEKLWSAASVKSFQKAAGRLEEHVCRMNVRGIPTQPPNGPGFCPYVNF